MLTFFFLLLYSIFVCGERERDTTTEKSKKQRKKETESEYSSYFDLDIDLFLPKYDFQRPNKFLKKQYNHIYKYLNSSYLEKKNENFDDVFIIDNETLKSIEEAHLNDILDIHIKKEVNIEEIKNYQELDIFGYPESKFFEVTPKLFKNENTIVKNFADMKSSISFNPATLEIIDK